MPERLTPEALAGFLLPFSPKAQSLAVEARELLLAVFPDAIETAEGRELGYGFDRGYKGLVFTISMKSKGVNLGVVGGASLGDPDGLLCGTGRLHRHVDVLDTPKLADLRVRALLRRALEVRRAVPSVSAKIRSST